jgi:hypothetical protein
MVLSGLDAALAVTDAAVTSSLAREVVARVLASPLADDVLQRLVEQTLSSPEAERLVIQTVDRAEVDRLVGRLVDSPFADAAVAQVIDSRLLDAAITRVIDGPLFDLVVARLIASDGLWVLIDEIAQSPSVTAAISQQGPGFANQTAADRCRRALDPAPAHRVRPGGGYGRHRRAAAFTRGAAWAAAGGPAQRSGTEPPSTVP